MRKYILVLLTYLVTFGAKGQEKEFGKYVGSVYVTINGQNPKTFVYENDTIKVISPYISDLNVGLEIENKLSELIWVDYNSSYFIIDGKTSDLIPGQTYLKDVNLEIKRSKIAPNTRLKIDALSRDYMSIFNPIFSGKRAASSYKKTNDGAVERLIIQFESESGKKFKNELAFKVTSTEVVDKHKRELKKREKELKRNK